MYCNDKFANRLEEESEQARRGEFPSRLRAFFITNWLRLAHFQNHFWVPIGATHARGVTFLEGGHTGLTSIFGRKGRLELQGPYPQDSIFWRTTRLEVSDPI